MKPYDQQVGRSKEKSEGRIEILFFDADIFSAKSAISFLLIMANQWKQNRFFFNNLKIFLGKNILKGTLSNLDRKKKFTY